MRQGDRSDIPFMNLVCRECDLPELPVNIMDSCLCYTGEHGFFLLDPQSDTAVIVHVAILPQGRGLWGELFFSSMLEWAFTGTKIEKIHAMIPCGDRHVRRFATSVGMRLVHETGVYAYYDIGFMRWLSTSDACLRAGGDALSGFEQADQEMVKRIHGACAIMKSNGMARKAWYIYNLYAKLFGYSSED